MNWNKYEEDRKTLTEEEFATWPWYKLPWRYFKVEIILIVIALPVIVYGYMQL